MTMDEDTTLKVALAGRSISRFGDGELRLAVGGKAVSQVALPKLRKELCNLLREQTAALVCVPRISHTHTPRDKVVLWSKYATGKYTTLFGKKQFGSAFITRPDSAPWIDRPDYWKLVRDLWLGRDIVLVVGSDRSLREDMMTEARSIRMVHGSYHDSYECIDRIEEEIGTPSGPVILCLGATATILAERLARKNVHALDLGHIGMFMRRCEPKFLQESA